MWSYKKGFSDIENQNNAHKVKTQLEALKILIPEIIEMKVHINTISSSNMDIILDSLFENETTMAAYKVHPEHIKVSELITSVLQNRTVFDYYE
jgi:hypothetical protein